MMTTPTLAALAAPKGGASVPWDGLAGLMTTPTLAALAAPKGDYQSLGTARRD
jgi:hypothetical protein